MVTYLLLQYTCMVLMSEAFYGTEIRGNLCLIKGSAFTTGCCLTNRIFFINKYDNSNHLIGKCKPLSFLNQI